MSYRMVMPSAALTPYVKALAISSHGDAGQYIVLPDTAIVMGFQYSGSLSYKQGDTNIPLAGAGVTGLRDTYRVFSNTARTGTILVMFTETGAAAFFKVPLHRVYGQSLALDDLMLRSEMDRVVDRLCNAADDDARISIIEQFLYSHIDTAVHDELVLTAVKLIKSAHGQVRMSHLAKQLHISKSRLEKRFRSIVGATPKKFANVTRLRWVLNTSTAGDGLTQLALEAGYFDQAHFIKDFRSFTGRTPQQYFRK